MTGDSWLNERITELEEELKRFENAVAKHGLRVFHRDTNGEREVTDESRKALHRAIEEYRRLADRVKR